MIRVEEVSDSSMLGSYRDQWNALLARSSDASMFDTYEWLTSWIKAFWEGRAIRFLFFWNENELQGIAPLLQDEHGEVWCASSLVCPVNRHGNRASVICAENPAEIFEALITHLQRNRKCVKLAFPYAFTAASVNSILPATAATLGMSSLVVQNIVSPIVRVAGDWPSYLKSRSSHLAKEVKRKVKQFQKAGQVEIKIVSQSDECLQAMQDILYIDKHSWKQEKGVSLDIVPHVQRLYETFAQTAATSGLLQTYLLYLDSKPVCYVYGVVFHNEYYALRTSYDSEYVKLSPGIVLFDRILNDAFEQGRKVVDFGPGSDSRWKQDFANDLRTLVNVCVFSSRSIRCRCCGVYQKQLKPLIKRRLPLLVRMKNQFRPVK
jgi:CelD/BcsL family acetyltransferase involved in cellulose biosynthesis